MPVHVPYPRGPVLDLASGGVMIGVLLLFFVLGLMVYVFARSGTLSEDGQRRFGGHSDPWDSSDRPRGLAALRPQPRPKPVEPVFNPASLLESHRCEVCMSAPLVQFRSPATGSILEFCGHHGRKQEASLKDKGFVVTIDAR